MFLALFAFGTFWFWILLAIAIITIVIAVENDKGVLSSLVFIGSIIFLDYAAHLSIFAFMLHHPAISIGLFVLYALIGVGWSIAKWYVFLRNCLVKYKTFKEEFLAGRGVKTLEELTDQARGSFEYSARTNGKFNPKVASHKSDILFWMTYWPFSIAGTIFNDFFRKIFHHLYDEIAVYLQKMSDKTFASVKLDVK